MIGGQPLGEGHFLAQRDTAVVEQSRAGNQLFELPDPLILRQEPPSTRIEAGDGSIARFAGQVRL